MIMCACTYTNKIVCVGLVGLIQSHTKVEGIVRVYKMEHYEYTLYVFTVIHCVQKVAVYLGYGT
jgi:hypothetical protein